MIQAPQPLLSHLEELRVRLVRVVIAWLAASALGYIFAPQIYQFLVQPLAEAFGSTQGRTLIATGLAETFVTYISLAVYGGFFLAFPVIASEVYHFIAPGLFRHERRLIGPYLLFAPLLFFAGAAFAYYYVMPKAWHFFLSFEIPAGQSALPMTLYAKVSEYLALVMHILLAFGLAFQLPVVLMLLMQTGVISSATLARGRRYAVVALLSLAAVITPPDVVSQLLLFFPLYALYELSILGGRMLERTREAAARAQSGEGV